MVSLLSSWGVQLLLTLAISPPGPRVFRLGPILTPSAPLFLGPLGLDGDGPTGFFWASGLQMQTGGLLGAHGSEPVPHKETLSQIDAPYTLNLHSIPCALGYGMLGSGSKRSRKNS